MFDVRLKGVVKIAQVTDGLSNTVAASEQTLGMGYSGGGGNATTPTVLPTSAPPINPQQQILAITGGQNDSGTGIDTSPAACVVGATGFWRGTRGGKWLNGHYGDTIYNHSLAPNAKTFDCVNSSNNAGLTAARSRHTGGVMTLLCDGSVRFVSDNIDMTTWRALASRGGGEVLGEF